MACVTSTTVTPRVRSRRTSAQVSRRGSRVQTGAHLVQHHHLGSTQQGEHDEQALLLAAGQAAEGGTPAVAQAPLVEQLVGVGRLPVAAGEHRDRLAHLHPLGQDRGLQLHAHPLAYLGRVGGRVQAQHPHRAAVGAAQAGGALDGGGLAGAVGAEHAEDLAGQDGQGQAVDGDLPVVGLAQVTDLEHGRWRHGPRVRRDEGRAHRATVDDGINPSMDGQLP
jgi:hypothetical protein